MFLKMTAYKMFIELSCAKFVTSHNGRKLRATGQVFKKGSVSFVK